MKRFRLFTATLFLIVCIGCFGFASPISVSAESASNTTYNGELLVQDDAGLLDEDELQSLQEYASKISEEHDLSVAIVTTPDFTDSQINGSYFGENDILRWEQAYLSELSSFTSGSSGDNTDSGILLAVSMSYRDWGIQTSGNATDALGTYARETIGSSIQTDLSDGEYEDAFRSYLSMTDTFLTAAENGDPYTYDNPYRESIPIPLIILAAFIISLIVSLIIVITWKKSMCTRIRQDGAEAYLQQGSFQLTGHSDIFLYHHVTRTRREKSNQNGGGNMKSNHSGTHGKF
jgi:uncharacterized protein